MAKAILTTKVDPTYDDLPEQRYHFPRTYLRQVEAARGELDSILRTAAAERRPDEDRWQTSVFRDGANCRHH